MSKASHKHPRTPSKIRPVPIPQMRTPPALVTQREFRKAHGDEIAKDLDLNKLGFPIVNWRDGVYWVVDGQHRIYALKENGFGDEVLDCEVYEGLSDAEMADIFLGRDARRPISPFDKFHVACTANHERETAIRRAVETQGLKIGRAKEENTIGAVAALGSVYDLCGKNHEAEVVIGQVVRTLKNAYAGDATSFDAHVIRGLGLLFNRYNGRTHEKELTASLAAVPQGVRTLLRRAAANRERTGNLIAQSVAAVVVEVYNRGRAHRERLPPWVKESPANKFEEPDPESAPALSRKSRRG